MYQKICVFGDSITEGSCDLPEQGGWTGRLGLWVKKNNPDSHYYNLGISADCTERLLKRFDVECSARSGDVIVFAIGMNDSQYNKTKDNPRVSNKKFKKNLKKLLKLSKKYTEKPIFVGLNNINDKLLKPIPWDESKSKFYDQENVEKYNAIIKNFCEENNLLFIDIIGLLEADDLEDGLHPNEQGHAKIFAKVKNELVKNKIIN